MGYQEKSPPPPHFTVQVRIIEVTPPYRTGNAPMATAHERATDELVNMTVRADSKDEALEKAMALLETEKA